MPNVRTPGQRAIFYLFLGAQLLLPLASIIAFQIRYHYPLRVIVYHLLIVGAGYGVPFGAAALLLPACAARFRRFVRSAFALAWAGWTLALYFLNLLAWGGRLGMGINLTLPLVLPYLRRPSLVTSTFSVSPVLFWGTLLVVPALITLAYLASASAFGSVILGLGRSLRSAARAPLPPARQGLILATAGGLVLAASVAVCLWPPVLPNGLVNHTSLLSHVANLFGDPIIVSMRETNSQLPLADLGAASDSVRRDYVSPARFRRKNVILIVIDACRADHLGVMGYARDTTPFLNSLQSGGHLRVVRSFYSASCCTLGGVLTLLRSQHWFHMSKRAFALQDVLKKVGYRVHFVLGGDHANFQSLKFYYGNSLDSYSDGASPDRHFALNDDRGISESLDRVAASDGTPAFFYFHLMSTHVLGPRLAENLQYQPAAIRSDPVEYLNNYDNGIIQTDKAIRGLFTQLAQKGYLQNSVVVITGDHGESLGERQCYGHGFNFYQEEITPPLLIYDPEPVTYHNLDFARQIDVAPTILDRLGLPIPANWDGSSLLHDDPERFSYLRMADLYAVLDHQPARTLKYIYDARARTEEIYDVDRDPHDQRNLFPSTDAAEVRELRTAIGNFSVHPGS